ncbi:MAG: GNAT family N-acetyltransferase [Candidatus Omnitrophica bacterium]|nr:GNAT family N-acetyltransferase [Candidatus Omnitrophota bacterium]
MIVSKRHKRSSLKTKVTRKITDVPAGDWNKVFPDVLESYDFFRTLDESNLTQFSFYYLMVYERNSPVGATVCFMLDYSLDTSINGPLRRLTNSIKKAAPRVFSLKTFICGMPIGQGRLGTSGRTEDVIKVMVRRIEQIAKKNKAAVIAFKDFDSSYKGMLDPLRKHGFTRFDSLPTTEMNVRFRDFEDYLKSLSAANRYDLRRKFKKVDNKVKIDLEITDGLDEDVLKDVYKLYLDIVEKHDMGFELLPVEFFRNISRNMAGRVKFFLWKIDGKLAAFLLCLVSKDMLIDYYVGLDYEVAYKYHLYFVKFRDVLNWCMKNDIKRYEMGITGYEPKRRLGFELIPLYLYVKLRNRALRPVFNLICQFLKFENFDPSLKKAKERQAS